jgi:hypothetical protein
VSEDYEWTSVREQTDRTRTQTPLGTTNCRHSQADRYHQCTNARTPQYQALSPRPLVGDKISFQLLCQESIRLAATDATLNLKLKDSYPDQLGILSQALLIIGAFATIPSTPAFAPFRQAIVS